MIRSVSIAVLASMFSVTTNLAIAQSPDPGVEESFFEFFRKTCLLNMPRLDKVKAAARLFNWPPVSGDAALLIAPSDPNAPFEGWSAPHDGRVLLVAVSEGILNGRKVVVCTAMERRLDQDVLVRVVEGEMTTKRSHDEVEHRQRYRGWVASLNGEQILLSLTTNAAGASTPATLAVIASAGR